MRLGLTCGCLCSLAWAELRLGFAHVFRKFEPVLAGPVYVFLFLGPLVCYVVLIWTGTIICRGEMPSCPSFMGSIC